MDHILHFWFLLWLQGFSRYRLPGFSDVFLLQEINLQTVIILYGSMVSSNISVFHIFLMGFHFIILLYSLFGVYRRQSTELQLRYNPDTRGSELENKRLNCLFEEDFFHINANLATCQFLPGRFVSLERKCRFNLGMEKTFSHTRV